MPDGLTLATKRCPACDRTRPAVDFYREPGRSGGLSSMCRACKRESQNRYFKADYYPAHKEAIVEAVTERRKKDRS